MPTITLEEVERQLMVTNSWKAPGEDGLPAILWKMTWPTVKHRVLDLFQASLEEGTLPRQWRDAKIIPLRKPNKENYTTAKAWRPISLLATLGKIPESVVAERISHAVETHRLLPTSHFGARKQRSAEQALLLLQEQIYTAWRGRRLGRLIMLRCQRSLQSGLQRTTASEDEGARDIGNAAPVDRDVLLGANREHPDQRASLGGPEPSTGWPKSGFTSVPDPIPLLQGRPRAKTDRQSGRRNCFCG